MVQPAAIDSSLTVERDIAATRQQVWNVIADGWTYSQWVVGNTRMRAVDPRWPAPGAVIHHTIGIWPVVLDDETEVKSSTPLEELVLLAKGRPFGGARITLRPSDSGAGCRVEMAEVPVGARSTGCLVDWHWPRPIPGIVNAWPGWPLSRNGGKNRSEPAKRRRGGDRSGP